MKLPSWEVCKEKYAYGISSGLEDFIYNYEPMENDIRFRKDLSNVLDEFRGIIFNLISKNQ